MTFSWLDAGTAAAFALGLVTAVLIVPPILRRYPLLLYPGQWRAARRLRRARRRMSVPRDRLGP